jgi:hypothetical protein
MPGIYAASLEGGGIFLPRRGPLFFGDFFAVLRVEMGSGLSGANLRAFEASSQQYFEQYFVEEETRRPRLQNGM